MSINTAIIVNAVLGLAALGALALVCRSPFRDRVMGRDASEARDQRATARPTASRSGQRGGATAAAMTRSAR